MTEIPINQILQGDSLAILKTLPDECVNCVITSPPYFGLRNYQIEGQIGLEDTFEEYLDKLLLITKELKRVLKKTGTMFWNHGDSYGGTGDKGDYQDPKYPEGRNGQKESRTQGFMEKCLLMQPYRLAQRMIDEQGWILRNVIIWHKPSCMPCSVKDRFTVDFEYVFFFVKNQKYWFEQQFEPLAESTLADSRLDKGLVPHKSGKSLEEDSGYAISGMCANSIGRNKRTVWQINTQPFAGGHFAVFPEELVETPIRAGCPEFICKKCGKAREKTYEKLYKGTTKSGYNDGYGQGKHLEIPTETERGKFLGYSDCGCDHSDGWDKGIVLDHFAGSCTTCAVAKRLDRNYIGIELNPEYIKLGEMRIKGAENWHFREAQNNKKLGDFK